MSLYWRRDATLLYLSTALTLALAVALAVALDTLYSGDMQHANKQYLQYIAVNFCAEIFASSVAPPSFRLWLSCF